MTSQSKIFLSKLILDILIISHSPQNVQHSENFYKTNDISTCIENYARDLNKNLYFATVKENTNEVNILLLNQQNAITLDGEVYINDYIGRVDQNKVAYAMLSENVIDNFINDFDNYSKADIKSIFIAMKELCNQAKVSIEKNTLVDKNSEDKTAKQKEELSIPTIPQIFKLMKEEIIGQDETIKKVLLAIDKDKYTNDPTKKCRCLIVGPTGTGKTQIMRSLSKIIKVPFVKVDSTQITMSGYVGGTIEGNILRPLLEYANGDIKLAQRGIVDLEEIDKKGSSDNYDVSGRGVLNSFLPFFDGTVYHVKYNERTYDFDTSNLSIFASGVFSNVFNSLAKNSVGFNSNNQYSNKNVTVQDFVEYGNIPDEFMGRMTLIAIMNELTLDDYKRILTESKNSPLLYMAEYLYKAYNIKMKYYDKTIENIANKAIKSKIGGRALSKIVEEITEEARWEIMNSDKKYQELVLKEEIVEDSKKYVLR